VKILSYGTQGVSTRSKTAATVGKAKELPSSKGKPKSQSGKKKEEIDFAKEIFKMLK